VVLTDDDDAFDRIAQVVGDGTIHLALDGAGGAATARLAKTPSQRELVGYAYTGSYSGPDDLRGLVDETPERTHEKAAIVIEV
jgi:hypothetical protein